MSTLADWQEILTGAIVDERAAMLHASDLSEAHADAVMMWSNAARRMQVIGKKVKALEARGV